MTDALLPTLRDVLYLGGVMAAVVAWGIRQRAGITAEIGQRVGAAELLARDTDERADEIERRVDRIEARVDGLPTASQIQQVHLDLASLSGQVGVLIERLDGHRELTNRLENVLNRHEDFLTREVLRGGGAK
jgi:tetrahydromethanopterin S-methyltransferase subunit G